MAEVRDGGTVQPTASAPLESRASSRACYDAPLSQFLAESSDSILGQLAQHHRHDLEALQKQAWLSQIEILRSQLARIDDGHVFFEFGIPRMGKRADVMFVHAGIVFVLEFKVGAERYLKGDIDQTVDYGLDLKHFHEGSHDVVAVPILVATEAPNIETTLVLAEDGLAACVLSNAGNLGQCIISSVADTHEQPALDAPMWAASRYKPTPTIVQAAQALYRGHDVKEISRSDAGAKNLSETASVLAEIIERSKRLGHKAICFVTGVPGAGKTLAGLNITTNRMRSAEDEHAVFLSGNGPLVDVLREALARDEHDRSGGTKRSAVQRASAFTQNVHHFRDDNLETDLAPVEKVVVFDEAQRAWDKDKAASFMKQKRGLADFDQSEPEFLIRVMDRHDDWCVIIALIGGGQEINTGEAGLPEWFVALRRQFPEWRVYYSDVMDSDEYIQAGQLEEQLLDLEANAVPELHLGVSVRSFRAENCLHSFTMWLPTSLNKLGIWLTRSLLNIQSDLLAT